MTKPQVVGVQVEPWVRRIFAHPVTKQPDHIDRYLDGRAVVDARVFLRNSYGFTGWESGQAEYEAWALKVTGKATRAEELAVIEAVRPVYEHFPMRGRILDCGGGAGRLREFLPGDAEYVSTDPWLQAVFAVGDSEKTVYACLNQPCNFIGATAEFQPFVAESFDWVHMRSMLDHVQVADLALLEAWRVLREGGHLLVGLYVEGGKSGRIPLERKLKGAVKSGLEWCGIDRWKDHHTWHPTYPNLIKLITDNGFETVDTYWQPCFNDTVCYVKAVRRSSFQRPNA